MHVRWSKALAPAVIVLTIGAVDDGWAQSRKQRSERALELAPSVPSIMVDVDEHGMPIIMKDSRARPKNTEAEEQPSRRVERPRRIPRGSSAYVTPVPLPDTGRSSGIRVAPPPTTYFPPAINNPSDRITQSNHSFPLNGGLGNNPTDRDAYVRYRFNQ